MLRLPGDASCATSSFATISPGVEDTMRRTVTAGPAETCAVVTCAGKRSPMSRIWLPVEPAENDRGLRRRKVGAEAGRYIFTSKPSSSYCPQNHRPSTLAPSGAISMASCAALAGSPGPMLAGLLPLDRPRHAVPPYASARPVRASRIVTGSRNDDRPSCRRWSGGIIWIPTWQILRDLYVDPSRFVIGFDASAVLLRRLEGPVGGFMTGVRRLASVLPGTFVCALILAVPAQALAAPLSSLVGPHSLSADPGDACRAGKRPRPVVVADRARAATRP